MREYKKVGNLHVAAVLYHFIEQDVLPGLDLDNESFWNGFEQLIHELAPRNKELLQERDVLQQQLDKWHQENRSFNQAEYRAFLQEIGYLEPEPKASTIMTTNVDDEIAEQAGPQLVVPITMHVLRLMRQMLVGVVCTTLFMEAMPLSLSKYNKRDMIENEEKRLLLMQKRFSMNHCHLRTHHIKRGTLCRY